VVDFWGHPFYAMTKNSGPAKKAKDVSIATPPFSLCSDDKTKDTFASSFEEVTRLLQGRKNIIVLVGAGISVSCGIPDFRSKDSGLYSTLNIDDLGLNCPEDLFDWDFFQEDPTPFFKFARNLYFPLGEDKKVEPSDSHKLLAMLDKKKMLLRVYSQNIDGLEHLAGVSNRKMIYAHGSLQWATCCECQRKVVKEEILPAIVQGSVPRCQTERKQAGNPSNSSAQQQQQQSPREPSQRVKKRQRVDDDVCGGVFKPGVTFFGETLNDNVRRSLEADRDRVDALIVIGTSLSV
jgi:NAD-dependent SIR2 family protein deacetylase